MAIAPEATSENRRRRTHKKSRRGCSSCKLRRVKCDEGKPSCQKCRLFGVTCTYESKSSGLTFAGESSFRLDEPPAVETFIEDAGPRRCESEQVASKSPSLALRKERSPRLSKPRALNEASLVLGNYNLARDSAMSGCEDFDFGIAELEILRKFNERTVLSVGTAQAAKIYQREVFQLACTVSFRSAIVTNGQSC